MYLLTCACYLQYCSFVYVYFINLQHLLRTNEFDIITIVELYISLTVYFGTILLNRVKMISYGVELNAL